jgi:hypothetical protein
VLLTNFNLGALGAGSSALRGVIKVNWKLKRTLGTSPGTNNGLIKLNGKGTKNKMVAM